MTKLINSFIRTVGDIKIPGRVHRKTHNTAAHLRRGWFKKVTEGGTVCFSDLFGKGFACTNIEFVHPDGPKVVTGNITRFGDE